MPELGSGSDVVPRARAVDDVPVAYIKPVTDEGLTAYAVFAADGQPLAVAPSRDIAIVVIRQNGLVPVDAH